jgi:hypothetical protein
MHIDKKKFLFQWKPTQKFNSIPRKCPKKVISEDFVERCSGTLFTSWECIYEIGYTKKNTKNIVWPKIFKKYY